MIFDQNFRIYLANAFGSFIRWFIIRSAGPIILALIWLIIARTEFFHTLSLALTIYIIVTVDQLVILTLIASIAPYHIYVKSNHYYKEKIIVLTYFEPRQPVLHEQVPSSLQSYDSLPSLSQSQGLHHSAATIQTFCIKVKIKNELTCHTSAGIRKISLNAIVAVFAWINSEKIIKCIILLL